jgi:hypothetical protein
MARLTADNVLARLSPLSGRFAIPDGASCSLDPATMRAWESADVAEEGPLLLFANLRSHQLTALAPVFAEALARYTASQAAGAPTRENEEPRPPGRLALLSLSVNRLTGLQHLDSHALAPLQVSEGEQGGRVPQAPCAQGLDLSRNLLAKASGLAALRNLRVRAGRDQCCLAVTALRSVALQVLNLSINMLESADGLDLLPSLTSLVRAACVGAPARRTPAGLEHEPAVGAGRAGTGGYASAR